MHSIYTFDSNADLRANIVQNSNKVRMNENDYTLVSIDPNIGQTDYFQICQRINFKKICTNKKCLYTKEQFNEQLLPK